MSSKTLIKSLRHRAEYLVVRLAISILQALPPGRCEQFAGGMAIVCGRWLRLRGRVVRENLATAFPQLTPTDCDRVTVAMWRHLFLMLAEIAHTPRKLHPVNWRELVDVPQVETILRALMQQRPTIMLAGHYGNFELGGYLLGMFGFPSHTVARTLDNLLLDEFVNEFRGRTGQHMLPKSGSRDAVEKLLGENGTLALLGDQAAGDKACWVNFFGRPASTHKAVALFCLGYDAPMLVTATRRTGGMMQYKVELEGQVDPTSEDFEQGSIPLLAEWYTARLEEMIGKSPEQYWWVHRRWKGNPPKSAVRRLAKPKEAA